MISQRFLRQADSPRADARLAPTGELQTLRYFTRLSQKNFSIDTHFYPLGSCTMKYNPRVAHQCASHPGVLHAHPLLDAAQIPGYLYCMHDLQNMLCTITGMTAISMAPMAGAQGEFAGVAMIKAYHTARGDTQRTEMIIPDAAHGTNPASAVMCGMTVKEVATLPDGDVDIDALKALLSDKTAGIMLTNPSTLGVFERRVTEMADLVHAAGGLLYYDGANLNAIMGRARPGDMGFDVMHLNLHKTFATPHGGGGPGAGPVACNDTLKAYLPIPYVMQQADGSHAWTSRQTHPDSIGRLNTFMGNAGVLLRAYVYAKMLGKTGVERVGLYATLNANYLAVRLQRIGYPLAFPGRRATHEFIVTLKPLTDATGVTALDVAKRLLDYGFYAPTIYFPLHVPECLLIEPTETESKEALDAFIDAMRLIFEEIQTAPDKLKQAPSELVLSRLDEVRAAREMCLADVV